MLNDRGMLKFKESVEALKKKEGMMVVSSHNGHFSVKEYFRKSISDKVKNTESFKRNDDADILESLADIRATESVSVPIGNAQNSPECILRSISVDVDPSVYVIEGVSGFNGLTS